MLFCMLLLLLTFTPSAFAGRDEDLLVVAKEAHGMFPIDIPFNLPNIVFEDPKQMYSRVCKGKCPPGLRIIGMYRANILTLRNDFNPQSDFDLGYFVHEMVHHFQDIAENLHGLNEPETCESRGIFD